MDNNSKISKEYVEVSMEFTKRFSSTSENRQRNHGHVSKLKEQMKHSLKNFPPININKLTNHIIDGQHRLEAFQNLVKSGELPIDSTISVMYSNMPEEEEREAVINANTNSKNWSLDDFMKSFAEVNAEYKKLENWGRNHSLCYDERSRKIKFRYAAAILKRQNCTKILKNGEFFISKEDEIKGEEMHSELVEILAVLKKRENGAFIESIVLSWTDVRTLHPFKEWLKELKLKKATIDKKPFSNKKDWDLIFSIVSTAINIKNK
jgi:ParB-like chromosome segregation protein Spo0J